MMAKKQFSLIPAIDIKQGLAVRGVAGQRDLYQPLQSPLVQNGDFLSLMDALQATHSFESCYVADLDAIVSKSIINLSLINAYRKHEGAMLLMVDAGVSTIEDARFFFDQGIDSVVVGTETLLDLNELQSMLEVFGPQRLVLSVDTKDGRVISSNDEVSEFRAPELICRALSLGVEEVILLQLSQVGTRGGLDKKLISKCLAEQAGVNPNAAFYVGGGVASREDLEWLEQSGASGAIVSTILHQGLLDISS